MAVTFEGVSSSRALRPAEKFRATWSRDRTATLKTIASLGVLSYNAPAAAQAIVQNLPPRGAYAVSAPAVSPGDETFVLDVMTAGAWQGTAAALATMLDQLTPSYDLVQLKAVNRASETAAEGEADRQREQQQAEERHDDNDLGSAIERALKQLVVYSALAGVAFLVLTNLPTIAAAGRVAGKVAKRVAK